MCRRRANWSRRAIISTLSGDAAARSGIRHATLPRLRHPIPKLDVARDWIEPARQVRIRVDHDEAHLLGLSSQAVRAALNTVLSGIPVPRVRVYLIDVVVRVADERRSVPSRTCASPNPTATGSVRRFGWRL
jgi:multidrug efflux pump subunit AcrB